MNRGQLRKEVRMMIGDIDLNDTLGKPNNPEWDDSSLDARLDLAHEKIVDDTGCVETRFTEDIVSGTSEYDLPDNFLYANQVLYLNSDSIYVKLQCITEAELDMTYPQWRDEDRSPTHYYIRRSKIGLYPNPDTSTTNGLRIDCIRRPDVMADDTVVPFQSIAQLYPFHRLISELVAVWCKRDKKDYDGADRLYQDYLMGIRNMKSRLSERWEDRRILNAYETCRQSPRRTN